MWVEGTATKEELDFLYNIDKDDKLKIDANSIISLQRKRIAVNKTFQ